MKYFDELNSDENYIIAPQAQSKYYLGSEYRHVGASWLTKENTLTEIENVMCYFDAVLAAEKIPDHINLIALGYSQGVSVIARYIVKRRLSCNQIIFLSGRIPKEVNHQDFKFLTPEVKVAFVYGTEDEYLTDEILDEEKEHFHTIFDHQGEILSFDGQHEIKKEVLRKFI